MLEPLSLAAITAVLGAVGSGMANEAGKWAWESTGGFVRRITGREVPAPTGRGEVDDVARLIHAQVCGDPRIAASWGAFADRVSAGGAPGTGTGQPRMPVSIRFFTDRKEGMKLLHREATRRPDGSPRIALVHGPDGMGSSTLAVHYGTSHAPDFPDGQLYADLMGDTTAGPRDVGTVLRGLLRQLGFRDEEMPTATDRLGEFFRRCVADRRLLVVLDHAHSAAQIRPLLTSAPAVFTIVVARHPFPGLDAVRVPVGPLADKDAVSLLTDLAGKPAVAAARATLPSLLARCGGSPYALRAAVPRLSVPQLPSQRTTATEPPAMPDNDPVRSAAEDTYRSLEPAAARLYRLMALREWPAFDATAAAHTTGEDRAECATLLEDLADRMLLERHTDERLQGRYHYRPAIRAHAEGAAAREDGIAACSAALARTLRGYAELAASAAHGALPESWRVPAPASSARHQPGYADRGEALDVLLAESGNLVQAVRCAEESGDPDTVVRLCRSLWPLQLKAGQHEMLLPALRTGARIADTHCPGTTNAGALHAQLAHTLTELMRWDEAEAEALAAARDEQSAGHVRGHSSAVEFLGLLRLRQWRHQEAYDCFDEAGAILDGLDTHDDGAADLPRARALLERHRGRALRGLGRRDEATETLGRAVEGFRALGDTYNTARALTDLAETRLDAGETDASLPLIDEAITTLTGLRAEYHLSHLLRMRERCTTR
ncbi:tetratricopeptide repeat protein [Streptomyces sp. NPDC055749]